QKNVFTCQCHWAIGSSNNKNRALHLCGTGNHDFDGVSVAWGVDVSVVTFNDHVLKVRDVNGNNELALFVSTIDVGVVALFVELWELIGKNLGDRSGQGGFTMVNVTDGTDVNVRLCPLELCLRHRFLLELFDWRRTCSRLWRSDLVQSTSDVVFTKLPR